MRRRTPCAASVRRAVLAAALLALGGCGLLGGGTPAPIEDRLPRPAPRVETPAPAPITPRQRLSKTLYGQFRIWKGTPYRMGGTSRDGIDCSAYVAEAFRPLGIDLPRTTLAQVNAGRRVPRDELGLGDLVFFKTGRDSRHVGIYLDRGEFMHASRQRGVMISSIHNRYWRNKFWQARRIYE